MKATSKFFGEFEYRKKDIINFPKGMPGFEDTREYVIIDNPDGGGVFKWLQSLERPDLAFVVINPFIIKPDYDFELPDWAADRLGLGCAEDALVLTIVTVPENINNMTTNLKAPIVINTKNGMAIQVALDDERYSLRHPMAGAMRDAG